MWIAVLVLIIIVLYLIKISCENVDKMKEADNETENSIADLMKRNNELQKEHLIDIHNNMVLINKNKENTEKLIAIENIIIGKRTDEEKVKKIKELLRDRNNNSN